MKPKAVDLTMSCSNNIEGFRVSCQSDPPLYLRYACYVWDLSIKSHCETYFETSAYVFCDG